MKEDVRSDRGRAHRHLINPAQWADVLYELLYFPTDSTIVKFLAIFPPTVPDTYNGKMATNRIYNIPTETDQTEIPRISYFSASRLRYLVYSREWLRII